MVQVPTLQQTDVQLKPTEINPKTAATLGGEIVDLGKGLSALGDYFEKLRDVTQITKAKTAYWNTLSQAHEMALKDPDPWTASERIDKFLQQGMESASKGITGGEARNKFIQEASLENDRRSYAFDSTLMMRQTKDAKNAQYQNIDSLIDQGKIQFTPGERDKTRQDIIAAGDTLKNTLGINPKAVDNYINTQLHQMDNENVASDLKMSATGTLRQLELGEGGQYKYLDPGQRAYWMDKAKAAVVKENAQNKEIFTIARNAKEEDMLQRRWKGEVGLDDKVIKLAANHSVSMDFARAWQDASESPKTVKAETDASKYMNLMDTMQNQNISAQDKRKQILKGIADGWLTENDAKNLYHAHYVPDANGDQTSLMQQIGTQNADQRDNIIADNQEKKQSSNGILSWMKSIGDAIKKYTSNTSKQASIAQAVNKQIVDNKVKPNEIPGIVMQHLGNDVLKSHPEIKNYPKEGVVKPDKYGNKIRFFPDGSYRLEDKDAS